MRDSAGIAEWNQDAAIVCKKFGSVPIRCRYDSFARAERVRKRSRSDLSLIEIRSDVNVRSADELLQVLQVHETVIEDDVFLNVVLFREYFEAQTISFAVLPQFVGMSCAQHNIDNFRKLRNDLRQCI